MVEESNVGWRSGDLIFVFTQSHRETETQRFVLLDNNKKFNNSLRPLCLCVKNSKTF